MNFFLRFFLLLSLFSFLFLFPFSALAWTGKVVGVADGDTIKVLHNSEAVRIRLWHRHSGKETGFRQQGQKVHQ